MKKLKRILSILLAGSIIFIAACNGSIGSIGDAGLQSGPVMGRYVEIDVTPPIEGRFSTFVTDDGTIVCFDAMLTTRYESKDNGESWSAAPLSGRDAGNPGFLLNSTMLSDGSLLAFAFNEGLVLISPDGSSQPFPMSEIDSAIMSGDSAMVSLLQALDNDRLVISYMIGSGAMMQFGSTQDEDEGEDDLHVDGDEDVADEDIVEDEEDDDEETHERSIRGSAFSQWEYKTLLIDLSSGEIIRDFAVEGALAAISDDTDLYLMDSSGVVSLYDLRDGSHSGKPDISFVSGEPGGQGLSGAPMRMVGGLGGARLMALGRDGKLYSEHGGDLRLADTDGSIEIVLEGTAYAIGAPRNTVDSIFVLGDESILVGVLSNGQSNRLYKYVWDENASLDPGKTITIWSLEDNNFVRAAISEMRKRHPDAIINYDVALDGFSAVSTSDAIRNLNTRLLGGNAPDVIILDGCAVESYVGRGMLVDLSELIDFSDVYDSLQAPFVMDGKLYCLPAQFLMPVLMGSSEALSKAQTIDELVALVLNGNVPELSYEPGADPFASTPEDQRAELSFADLKELFDLSWVSAAPGIVNNNRLDSDALRRYVEAVKAISDMLELTDEFSGQNSASVSIGFSDGSGFTLLPGSLMRYFMQQANYAAFVANNLMVLQSAIDRDDTSMMLFPGFDPGAWLPSTIVGISADSASPDIAAEFVQTMLSTDVQQHNYGTGLPVTRSGLAAQIDTINNNRTQGGLEAVDLDVSALITGLQTLSISDKVLTDMIWSSIERCCKDEIDIEGAVREIEQNIRTYLAERA